MSERPNVELIRRVLLEDSIDVRDADDTIREEAPGTAGLCHPGVAAAVWAERGKGKSSVALVTAMAHAAAGGRVLYLDRENTPALNKARLKDILGANGWPDLLAEEKFLGRHYPMIERWKGEDVGEAIAGLGFTGVVYDSLREFLGQLGLKPDDEKDVTVFFSIFVTPLLQRGLWVWMLDNVGHAEKGRPKGSASKLDAAAQGYEVETTSTFSSATIGGIKITCKRSRYGDQDRTWTMRLGGGLFDVPGSKSEAPDAKRAQAATEARDELREAAVEVLVAAGGPLGTEKVGKAIRARPGNVLKFSAQALREGLEAWAADPTSGVLPNPAGKGFLAHVGALRNDPHVRAPATRPDTTAPDTAEIPAATGDMPTSDLRDTARHGGHVAVRPPYGGDTADTLAENGADELPEGWTMEDLEDVAASVEVETS
jgi:hypothetical protein